MEPGKDSSAGSGSLEVLKRYFTDAPGAQRLVPTALRLYLLGNQRTAASISPMPRSARLSWTSPIAPAASLRGKVLRVMAPSHSYVLKCTQSMPRAYLPTKPPYSHSAIISSAVEIMVHACSSSESDIRLSATENLRRLIKVRNCVRIRSPP